MEVRFNKLKFKTQDNIPEIREVCVLNTGLLKASFFIFRQYEIYNRYKIRHDPSMER